MENLLGQKFGRLTVIKFAGIRKIKSKTPRRKHILTYYWECRCDCGNKATVTAGNLKAKNVKSCGCQIAISNRARTLPNGEAAFGCLFRRYRKQAIGRGLCFNLSKKLFREMTKQVCHYCGQVPSRICKPVRDNLNTGKYYIYTGIDRKNGDLGYSKGNCVPCCTVCNRAKNIMSYNEFKSWIERIKNG